MSYLTSVWNTYRHARARAHTHTHTHTHPRASASQIFANTRVHEKYAAFFFREKIWEYSLKRHDPFTIIYFQSPPFIEVLFIWIKKFRCGTPKLSQAYKTRDCALVVCRLIDAVQFIFSHLIGVSFVLKSFCLTVGLSSSPSDSPS
jgi:hypothetical protein